MHKVSISQISLSVVDFVKISTNFIALVLRDQTADVCAFLMLESRERGFSAGANCFSDFSCQFCQPVSIKQRYGKLTLHCSGTVSWIVIIWKLQWPIESPKNLTSASLFAPEALPSDRMFDLCLLRTIENDNYVDCLLDKTALLTLDYVVSTKSGWKTRDFSSHNSDFPILATILVFYGSNTVIRSVSRRKQSSTKIPNQPMIQTEGEFRFIS